VGQQGTSDGIFADLPEALVEEMLSHYRHLGHKMTASLEHLQGQKKGLRAALRAQDLLKNDSVLVRSNSSPTACAVDGAFAIERLMSTDIVAIAGLAVEGMTPPTETRHWERPWHRCSVLTVNHHDSTFIAVGAIMLSYELELAVKAPHDLVLLDGSLLTPLIRFNQAVAKINDIPEELADIFRARIKDTLEHYREILASKRTDMIFASVPKYTSRKEISRRLGIEDFEDRAMLSMVLNSGEVVGPISLLQSHEHPNFESPDDEMIEIGREILGLLHEVNVLYYKPAEYLPAIRVEVSSAVAKNQSRLSIMLEALRLQCSAQGIMEPYPLYMADRMVKHLGVALPALRRATTQEIAYPLGLF
jgi:hypothetical protein